MVALVIDEHLGLVGEAAEGGRVDDAVAVALEVVAGWRRRLGVEAAQRAGGIGGVRRPSAPWIPRHLHPRIALRRATPMFIATAPSIVCPRKDL
jgi:hypothetical protein